MQIQWFPGHMHKARLQIQQSLPKVDLIIDVLDSRIPFSSENPMLAELCGDKPCLKVLAKSDLADPERTDQWQSCLEKSPNVRVRAVSVLERGSIRKLTELCVKMLPRKGTGSRITTMIVGIPNVGKSTLINILASRTIAKTGNQPAVTKAQQRINIGDGITLLDTPGVLWPNLENKNSGLRLAATGAIKDTAMDYSDVAFFAAEYLLKHYPQGLIDRYAIQRLPDEPLELLEIVGRHKGCLRKGGVVDLDRVSRIFLHELRSGNLGRVTLETPDIVEQEKCQTAELRLENAANKRRRDLKRKTAFKEKQAAGKPRRDRGSRRAPHQ